MPRYTEWYQSQHFASERTPTTAEQGSVEFMTTKLMNIRTSGRDFILTITVY